MEAVGKYYKTIIRDEATAETEFDFSYMSGDCPEICRNGLLRCIGKISVMSSGIPFRIKGIVRNQCFYVEEYSLYDKSLYCAKEMLRYLTDNELTETQENKILAMCKNDVLTLMSNKTIVNSVLAKSKKRIDIQKKLFKKLSVLIDHEILTKELLKYGVELSKIEMLIHHDISYEQYVNNPYLTSLFHAISIFQADQFAYEKDYVQPYDVKRLCGFVMDSILLYKKVGHSCVRLVDLKICINKRLSRSIYPKSSITLSILNYCVHKLSKYIGIHVVDKEVYVYENTTWEEETEIIMHIQRLNKGKKAWVETIDLAQIESKLSITYNQCQRESFALLKESGVKILTGPPGSGKTAIIKGLIMAMEMAYPNVQVKLSATTGRAAQVISSSSKREAETVNKMLNIRPYGEKLHGKNQNDPIEGDLIIVDEVSMLGTKLASYLFSAVKTGSILLLVGDENQLQSVEYGNILQDLICSNVVEVYRLNEIMRQAGAICENALLINNGHYSLTKDDSFHIFECTEEEARAKLFQSMNKPDTQILSSVKKGVLGTRQLNREIQKIKNRGKKICLLYKQQAFYEQDSIILTETNYEKGYFNGDIGTIIGRDNDGLLVEFESKVLCLDQNDFHAMELAYVITTHKSQGSEFGNIHILLPRNPENMLTRRILYTAVTRAKKAVYIYSIDSSMEYSISNQAERTRISLLSNRISQNINEEGESALKSAQ